MSFFVKYTAALLVLLLTLAPAASGQTPRAGAAAGAKAAEPVDEVEQLLVRHVLALGGLAVFKVRTRVVRGRIELSTSPNPGSFESYSKEPGMEMSVINAPMGQYISATDGVSRWRQAPWGAATTSAGITGGHALSRGAKDKDGFKFRNVFTASRLKGRARVDGREVIVLAATRRGYDPVLMYFDAETYLLRKEEPDRAAGSRVDARLKAVHIDGYRTVDGVKVPSLFRVVTDQFTLTFLVQEVKHNVNISDALFRSPEGR